MQTKLLNDALVARLSFAINRLENLLAAKRTFIERMQHAMHLAKDPWQVRHTRDLIDTTKAEIAEIQAAIHDIRHVREAA